MLKKALFLYLFVFAGLLHVNAQRLSSLQGSFVDIGFGARPVAMGFAHVGLADDANAVYWNPAGLTRSGTPNATFMHTRQFQLIDYQFFAVSTPMSSGNHAMGLAVISSGDAALREISVHAGYGFKWKWLRAGAAGKFRNATFGKNSFNADDYPVFDPDEIDEGRLNQINGFASGYGLDAGFIISLSEQLTVGMIMRDLFAPVTWRSSSNNTVVKPRGEYNERLPFEWIGGVAYKAGKHFTAAADYKPKVNTESDAKIRVGAEWTLLQVLSLRAGTEQVLNAMEDETYTFGTGLQVAASSKLHLIVDYAYVLAPLANTHRFSLAIRF
jgi:hypothetical protein